MAKNPAYSGPKPALQIGYASLSSNAIKRQSPPIFSVGILVLAVVMVVSSIPWGAIAEPSYASRPSPAPQASMGFAPSPARVSQPSMPHASPGSVADTFVLGNQSLIPGNFAAGSAQAPYAAVYDSANRFLYVTEQTTGEGNVTVWNTSSNQMHSEVAVGSNPIAIALDNQNGRIYVVNNGDNTVTVIDTATNRAIASILVGSKPSAIAFDPTNGNMYVAESGANAVTAIDTATDTTGATIGTGSYPYGCAFDPANGDLYVADTTAANVTVINVSLGSVVKTIHVGMSPYGVAYDPSSGNVFVASFGNSNVSVISGTSNTVVNSLATGPNPENLVDDPVDGIVDAGNMNGHSITEIRTSGTGSVVGTVTLPVNQFPLGMAYDNSSGIVYAPNEYGGNMSLIDETTRTVLSVVTLSAWPGLISYNPRNGLFYALDASSEENYVVNMSSHHIVATPRVGYLATTTQVQVPDVSNGNIFDALYGAGNMTVISGTSNQVIANIPNVPLPEGGAYNPVNGYLYVSNNGKYGNITVLDAVTNSYVTTIVTGNKWGLAGDTYDPSNQLLYACDRSDDNITVVDTTSNSVVGLIPIGGSCSMPFYDSQNSLLYTVMENLGRLSVVNTTTNTVVATMGTGGYPTAIDLDTANGYLYIVNSQTNNVSVVDSTTNTIVGSIPVENYPVGVAYDPSTGFVYVTDEGSDSISVIAPPSLLASVNISPATSGVSSGNPVNLTATPSCFGGPCSSGTRYTWTFAPSLGVLNSSTGPTVTFTAGGTPGTEQVYVNATLNGVTRQSSAATITISSLPPLASVSVNPSADTIRVLSSAIFNATPTCTGGTCPSGTSFVWSLANGLGSLNRTIGTSVRFTAGSAPGNETLYVNGTLNGVTRAASPVPISINTTVATLTGVAVTPASLSLSTGQSHQFTATPSCSGGSCPSSGIVYAWVVNNSLGSVNPANAATTNFTAGNVAGPVTLSVTVSLNGAHFTSKASVTLTSSTSVVLSSVTVTSSASSIPVKGTATLTVTPTCSGGSCPTGVTFQWSLSNPSLGTLNSLTASTVTFTAGNSAGTETFFVNATLGTVTKLGGPATVNITSSSTPTLTAVSVNPSSVTVAEGSSQILAASAACSPSPCPASGISYSWSLNNSLGGLNSSTGATVTFIPGSTTGAVTVTVTADLAGITQKGASHITVSAKSSPPNNGTGAPSGFSESDLILIAAVVGAVAVVAIVALVLMRRKKSPGGAVPPPPTSNVPASPSVTPPPPGPVPPPSQLPPPAPGSPPPFPPPPR